MKTGHLILIILFIVLALFPACGNDDDDDNDDSSSTETDDDTADDDDTSDDDDVSDDDDTPADDDDTIDLCQSGLLFNFNLTEGGKNIPFPTDFYTENDAKSPTGIRVALPEQITKYIDPFAKVFKFVHRDMNQLDGFGVTTPVIFPANAHPKLKQFPGTADPGPEDSVFCIVLEDEDHPHAGEYWPMEVEWSEDLGLLKVDPYFPFHQDTTYGCVITDNLTTAKDNCYQRPYHLNYILMEEENPGFYGYETLEPYRKKYEEPLDLLFELTGIERSSVLALTIFTTQNITWDMLHVRQQLEEIAAENPPALDTDWTQLGTSKPNLDSVWEAEYDTINWRHDGHFDYDQDNVPVPNGTDRVMLRLSLPKPSAISYQQPYPVVIFGHGINSSRGESTSHANYLAEKGFATVGIDFLYHGFRDNTPSVVHAMLNIFDILHPLRFRDYFKQDVADLIYLKHLIRELSTLDLLPYETGGDGIPDLDTSHIFYASHSWGSIHGPILAATEPDIEGFMFNAGAVDLKAIALDGTVGRSIYQVARLIERIFHVAFVDVILMLLDIEFHMVDGGDSAAYTPYVFDHNENNPPNILHQMAAYDITLGGPACALMARTLGLTLMEPYTYYIDTLETTQPPYVGNGTYMYHTWDHGFVRQSDDIGAGARNQAGTYLRTCLENGEGTIIDPFGE